MRKSYWVIIIFAAIAIAAGLLYWAKQPTPDLGPIVVHHVAKPQASSTPADLRGWQTYISTTTGFSIQIPSNWVTVPFTNSTGPWTFQSTSTENNINGIGLPPAGNLWVNIAQGICNNPSSGFINEAAPGLPDISEKTVCKNTFQITLGYNNSDVDIAEDQSTLNQILSTFQLTNSINSSQAGQYSNGDSVWKTYTDAQYGFQFDYPPYFTKSGDTSYFIVNLTTDSGGDFLTAIAGSPINGEVGYGDITNPSAPPTVCNYSAVLQNWVSNGNGTDLKNCPQEMGINPNAKIFAVGYPDDYSITVDIPTPDQKTMFTFQIGQNFSCSGCVHLVNKQDWVKILSSFKFINPQTSWEIYKNNEYGFQFSYPQEYSFIDLGNDSILELSDNKNDKIKVALENEALGSYQNFQQYAEETAKANCNYQGPSATIYCPSVSQKTETGDNNGVPFYKIFLNRVMQMPDGKIQSTVVGPIYALDLSSLNNPKLSAVFVNMDGLDKDDGTVFQIVSSFKFIQQ